MGKASSKPSHTGKLWGTTIVGAGTGAAFAGPPGALIGGTIGFVVGAIFSQEEEPKKQTAKRKKRKAMAERKVVFVAFAIEDATQRDFLKGQSMHERTNFEFIDMSVKEAYEKNWKEKVRTRIKRSDGVIVLVSKNSLKSTGQTWEIECAKAEKKPIFGIWIYKDDRTSLPDVKTVPWTWESIESFLNRL